jgi:hypothetical protein
MDKTEIETYLAELGQELQDMGVQQPMRILLIGGAYMLTQVPDSRPNTNDIDVLLKDVDDPTSQLYRLFKAAVRTVASQNRIPSTWLNDVIGDFIRDVSIVPQGSLWQRYTMLEVYVPPNEYILALKLLAGRQKDRDDINILCQQLQVQTRKQAQRLVDQYIPDRQVQQINGVIKTLNFFFP